MGQYYNPTILKKDWKKESKKTNNVVAASLCCYDFDNGAKLMEHSWIGNNFVNAVAHLLATEFKGYPFVWVGDYADEVEGMDMFKMSRRWQDTPEYKDLLKKLQEPDKKLPTYKYIVNYTKKEYCVIPENVEDEWQIHPLPILTSSGNGRGGGDFWGNELDERVGSWAYDKIGVTNNKRGFAGFKEINSYFEEE